jgi:hypothetical protein
MSYLRRPRRSNPRAPRPAGRRPAVEELETRALPSFMTPLSFICSPLDASGSVPGYTPDQIRQAYGLNNLAFSGSSTQANGQGQTIAIVTAFDNPKLAADLTAFDAYFQLPDPPALTQVGQDGSANLPSADAGWAQETALDVEWAHAIAPGASLLVVEASSADEADLYAAVDTASANPKVSVVSMSFGGPEDPGETATDSHFKPSATHAGVTFVAAAGDSGTVTYPAASPWVVGVGGTSLTLDAQGNRASESAWANGGGGLSQYEPVPAFQQNVAPAHLSNRGTPDVAYDADPNTGFAVYDSYSTPGDSWLSMGGTSAGAPQWAALLAIANQGRGLAGSAPLAGGAQVLPMLYQLQGTPAFFDVTTGGNGHYEAGPGYDLVTGLGSPNGQKVLDALTGGAAGNGPVAGQPSGGNGGPVALNDPGSPPADPPPNADPPAPVPAPTADGFNVSAAAGSTLSSLLATLTDSSGTLTAAAFTATIHWGDGQTSAGTIVSLGAGTFAVKGSHAYAAAGSYTIAVTVTTQAGGSEQSATAQTLATIVPAPEPLAAEPAPAADLPPAIVAPLLPSHRHAPRHPVHPHHPHHAAVHHRPPHRSVRRA